VGGEPVPGVGFRQGASGSLREHDRFDYGEVRVYAIGVVNGLEIALIYTDVSETDRRIISAWRAERNERTAYWQSIGEQEALN
jgi:uncharacterized DUF497 family protein